MVKLIAVAMVTLMAGPAFALKQVVVCSGTYTDYGFSEKVEAGATIEREVAAMWFKSKDTSQSFDKVPALGNSTFTQLESSDSANTMTLRLSTSGLNAKSAKPFRGTVSYTGYFSGESVELSCRQIKR